MAQLNGDGRIGRAPHRQLRSEHPGGDGTLDDAAGQVPHPGATREDTAASAP